MVAGPLWAQDPPESEPAVEIEPAEVPDAEPSVSSEAEEEIDGETEPDSDSDSDEQEPPFATLVISADSPCNVYVDGVFKGSIEDGDEPLEVEVESSPVLLSGVSTEVSGARYDMEEDDALELEENEIREFELPILDAIGEFRLVERRQKVWRDLDLGLMWPKRDNAANITWPKARTYCEDLETGGYENWRLPSIDELESLEAKWSIRPYKIEDSIFLSSCCVWSGTQPAEGTALNVDFRYRRRFEANRNLSYSLRALCVREMVAAEIADALVLADPKEQKRRLKEKRQRMDERRRRKAERAAERAAKRNPDGGSADEY